MSATGSAVTLMEPQIGPWCHPPPAPRLQQSLGSAHGLRTAPRQRLDGERPRLTSAWNRHGRGRISDPQPTAATALTQAVADLTSGRGTWLERAVYMSLTTAAMGGLGYALTVLRALVLS